MVKISRPWLIHYLVGYHILASLECLCYFFPIAYEHVSHVVMVVPDSTEPLGDGVACVVSRPWMLMAVLVMRITVLVEFKRLHV